MQKTKLITQPTPHSCAIACLAMATGSTLEEVFEAAGDLYIEGDGLYRSYQVLEKLGYRSEYKNGEVVGVVRDQSRPYSVSPEYFRTLAWGRPALITVSSLNIAGGHHMVYYDGYDVYDPNPPERKRYTEFSELLPSNIILFRPDMAKSPVE